MIKCIFLFCAIFIFTVFSINTVAQSDELTILHFNDSHSTLSPLGPRTANLEGTQGGIARVASLIGLTQMSEPNVIVLHAGDVSIGDFFFTKYFAAAEFQLMNSLGFEAMAVGNHEFDLTPDALLGALQASFPPGSGFPLLSSNLIFDGTTPQLESYIEPYTIIQKGNVKVGIFSLLTPETNVFSQPAPIIVSDAIIEKAAEMVTILSTNNCDVVIMLSHLGVALDQVVASYVPGIDVVISGHDHYKFDTPLEIPNAGGETTLLVQAKSNYMYAGKMKLEISNGNIQFLDYQLIALDENIPEEQTVKAVVDNLILGIESTYGPIFSQQMGYSNAYFNEEATDLLNLGTHDTPIGNLVTDAFKSTFATDIAIQAGGSTTLPLWKGPLVAADVFRVNGYGFNTINGLGYQMVTFDMEGQHLLYGLEFGLSEIEKNDEFLLQVSGLQYLYDGTQPTQSRLVGANVNGYPIDPFTVYSVATNEFVLMILDYLGIPYSNVQLFEGVTEFHVLTDYILQQGGFIHPKELGRIINIGNNQSRGALIAGGWFNSEQGFYLNDPSAEGKMFFNIYLSNKFSSNQPRGMVNLFLQRENFRFRSSNTEWLLIENSSATVIGTGKLNGTGNYGFLITAHKNIEGIECPNGAVRLIIWDINDDERILYDNLSPQNLEGGRIYIKSIYGDQELILNETETESYNHPYEYSLKQNYPNPFNPATTIEFSIQDESIVQLKVYDIIGNEVATIVDELKSPGRYNVKFNADGLTSGVYIYSLRAGSFTQIKKMVLMK